MPVSRDLARPDRPAEHRPQRLGPGVLALGLAGLAAMLAPPSHGDDARVVHMQNVGAGGRFAFEPALLVIEPGERVRFLAVDSGHNSQSIPGMAPEAGPDWRSGIGQETEVTLDVEGVYGFKCRAHYSIGMVGLIVVGDPHANLAAAREVRHPERPHRVFEALFEEVERRFSSGDGQPDGS